MSFSSILYSNIDDKGLLYKSDLFSAITIYAFVKLDFTFLYHLSFIFENDFLLDTSQTRMTTFISSNLIIFLSAENFSSAEGLEYIDILSASYIFPFGSLNSL